MDFEGSSPDHFEYISHRARYFEYEYRRRKQTYTIVLVSMFLLTLIFSVLFLLPPVQGILSKKEQLLAAQVEGIKKIPDIESKLEKLQSQIQLLTTESIDTRLTKVETAIGSGSVKADQVKSFWQLAKEIDTLKGYMFKDPKELVELKELQKNYSFSCFNDRALCNEGKCEFSNFHDSNDTWDFPWFLWLAFHCRLRFLVVYRKEAPGCGGSYSICSSPFERH